MEMNYKQRLILELIELHDRRLKLENFIENNKIDDKNKDILNNQLTCMMDYEGILTTRLMMYLEGE